MWGKQGKHVIVYAPRVDGPAPTHPRTHAHTVIRAKDREAIQEMMDALEKVQRARARVHEKTTPFISFLSLKPLIFDQEELEVGDIHELLHMPHGLSVWLNILQVFLSTANAYITVPTTNEYAMALGVNAAYSGIIIGMSPLAQIFSAFVFSYWSNVRRVRIMRACRAGGPDCVQIRTD